MKKIDTQNLFNKRQADYFYRPQRECKLFLDFVIKSNPFKIRLYVALESDNLPSIYLTYMSIRVIV
jgi:hypothetical protein